LSLTNSFWEFEIWLTSIEIAKGHRNLEVVEGHRKPHAHKKTRKRPDLLPGFWQKPRAVEDQAFDSCPILFSC